MSIIYLSYHYFIAKLQLLVLCFLFYTSTSTRWRKRILFEDYQITLPTLLREVGRLAPDSLCTVPATLHGPCNNKRTLHARSLHNEHLMHTPCTVSPCTLPARSMHGPCTVTYEHRLVATFVITAPQLHITKPATNRHLKSGN